MSNIQAAARSLGALHLLEHFLLFIRTVCLARVLGPEGFGLSSYFLIIISGFSLMTDIGVEKFVLQEKTRRAYLAIPTISAFLICRGIFISLCIVVFSGVFAEAVGFPDFQWFFAFAAIVPFVEGFRNLDPFFHQRRLNMIPYVRMQVLSIVPGILCTVGLAYLTADVLSLLVGCVLSAVLAVLVSHVFADTPYRVGFSKTLAKRLVRFSWPLVISGIVIFASSQGDRVIIGAFVGVADLGMYAAAATFPGAASVFLARVIGSIHLPVLSSRRDNDAQYYEYARVSGSLILVVQTVVFVPLALFGDIILTTIFGEAYRSGMHLFAFLALAAGALVLRTWSLGISLSLGRTVDILGYNLIRLFSLCVAIVGVRSGLGVTFVAGCIMAGELCATGVSVLVVGRRRVRLLWFGIGLYAALLLSVFLTLIGVAVAGSESGWQIRLAIGTLSASACILGALILSKPLWHAFRGWRLRLPF